MDYNNEFKKGSSPATSTFFTSQSTASILLKEEEIKRADGGDPAFKPLFPDKLPDVLLVSILSFISFKDLHCYCFLINTRISHLEKTPNFWETIYLSTNNDQTRSLVLKTSLQKGYLDILHHSGIQQTLSFKMIAPLRCRRKHLLLYVLQQSQLSLRLAYCQKADQKKAAIEEPIQRKLAEFKAKDFRFPPEKPLNDEKISAKAIKEYEEKFLKLLQVFKTLVERDLTSYIKTLDISKQKYINNYFKAIFSTYEPIKGPEDFGEALLGDLDIYPLKFGDGDYGLLVGQNNYKTNALSLAVEVGNLYVLMAHQKVISPLIVASRAFGGEIKIGPKTFHPGKLMAIAASTGDEAVMQFLYEQGTLVENRDSLPPPVAIEKALDNYHNEAVKLVIAHSRADDLKATCSYGRKPLLYACDKDNYMGVLILLAAGDDIDFMYYPTSSMPTVLGRTAAKAALLINKVEAKLASELPNKLKTFLITPSVLGDQDRIAALVKLEMTRLLLLAGANPEKTTHQGAKKLLAIFQENPLYLTTSFLQTPYPLPIVGPVSALLDEPPSC